MFGVLVEGARAIEDLLVLFIVVALGARFIDDSDDVVRPAVVILTGLGSFLPITAAVPMIIAVVVAAVVVASVVGAVVVAARWAMSARILIEANFGLFNVAILIDSRDHLANPLWRLTIEFGAEVVVMESSYEGGDDFYFCNVGNRIPHLEKTSDVATEKLGRFLIDAI